MAVHLVPLNKNKRQLRTLKLQESLTTLVVLVLAVTVSISTQHCFDVEEVNYNCKQYYSNTNNVKCNKFLYRHHTVVLLGSSTAASSGSTS